jgi:hypothetical protein
MKYVTYGWDPYSGEVFRHYPQTVVAALEREYKLPQTLATLALLAASAGNPVFVNGCGFWVEKVDVT